MGGSGRPPPQSSGPPGEMAELGAGTKGCWPLCWAPGPRAQAVQRGSVLGLRAEGKDGERPSLVELSCVDVRGIELGPRRGARGEGEAGGCVLSPTGGRRDLQQRPRSCTRPCVAPGRAAPPGSWATRGPALPPPVLGGPWRLFAAASGGAWTISASPQDKLPQWCCRGGTLKLKVRNDSVGDRDRLNILPLGGRRGEGYNSFHRRTEREHRSSLPECVGWEFPPRAAAAGGPPLLGRGAGGGWVGRAC